MQELVFMGDFKQQKQPITSSRIVAEEFSKRHFDVLRILKTKLPYDLEFTESNFALSEYIDSTGRKLPEYFMTQDGFTYLANGFTGKRAALFQIKFIRKFREMEAEVHELREQASKPQYQIPASYADALRLLADQSEKITTIEIENQSRPVGMVGEDEVFITATKIAEIVNMACAEELNVFLRDRGIQYKKKGDKLWYLHPEYMNMGYAEHRLMKSGEAGGYNLLLWTPRGLEFIKDLVNKFSTSFKIKNKIIYNEVVSNEIKLEEMDRQELKQFIIDNDLADAIPVTRKMTEDDILDAIEKELGFLPEYPSDLNRTVAIKAPEVKTFDTDDDEDIIPRRARRERRERNTVRNTISGLSISCKDQKIIAEFPYRISDIAETLKEKYIGSDLVNLKGFNSKRINKMLTLRGILYTGSSRRVAKDTAVHNKWAINYQPEDVNQNTVRYSERGKNAVVDILEQYDVVKFTNQKLTDIK